ncbi:MAG: hypothetical protein WC506_05915 [Candidatus Micrarchaeia archaeon]
MRKSLILPVLLVLMLFFAGCTSNGNGGQGAPAAGNDTGNTAAPPAPPSAGIGGQVTGQGDQVPSVGGNTSAPSQPPASGTPCDVGFQLSSSNVYLVKVNFASPQSGLVTVQCPDGSQGVDKGSNLFLCEKLTAGSSVTAFLSGARCGGASFNSGASAGDSGSSTEPGTVSRCSLSVSPSSIYAGGNAFVDISASTPTGSNVVLDCGGEQKQIESGVVEKSTSCTFNSAGTARVALYVDSKECANASVTVLPQQAPGQPSAQPACSVETTKKDSVAMRYEGKVTYSGFQDGSVLKWDCFGAVFSQKLGASGLIGEKGVSGSINIYCQYSAPPPVSVAPVTIDSVPCGSLEVQ